MIGFKKGDIIQGKVTGILKYGVFLNINSLYNGLIHISEISDDFVRDIHDYVLLGEIIYCEILEVDSENYKLKLSIKNINYRIENANKKIQETRSGFLPLKNNLEIWINEKIESYQKK